MRPNPLAHPSLKRSLACPLRAGRRLLRDERGYSLVELMVALAVGITLFSATMGFLIIGFHAQIATSNRTAQLSQAQVAVAQLVRELRQATTITFTSASSLTYTEPSTGATSIVFSCSGTTCTRKLGANAAVTAITNLASTSVFSATPSTANPTYIGISLQLTATKRTNLTLSDGTDLRNLTLGK